MKWHVYIQAPESQVFTEIFCVQDVNIIHDMHNIISVQMRKMIPVL